MWRGGGARCAHNAPSGAFGARPDAHRGASPRLAGQRRRTEEISRLAFAAKIPRRHLHRHVPPHRRRRPARRRHPARTFLVNGSACRGLRVVRHRNGDVARIAAAIRARICRAASRDALYPRFRPYPTAAAHPEYSAARPSGRRENRRARQNYRRRFAAAGAGQEIARFCGRAYGRSGTAAEDFGAT